MVDEPWTDDELAAAIDTYLQMLELQRSGKPFVKADLIGSLVDGPLGRRTHKSAEYRMMNISAVRQDLGLPMVEGYRPATNVGVNVARRIRALMQARDGA